MEKANDKTLLLFDFDGTITDGDIAHTLLESTLNMEELQYVFADRTNYAKSMDKYCKLMKSKGKTMDDINPILESVKLNDGIEELFAYIKENKNKYYVVLITGDDLYITSYYLKYKKFYDLFDYFIGLPATFDKNVDDKMVSIQFLPPHTCELCDKSLCKTNEFLKFLDKNPEFKKSKIFYVCDGWNDYCLSKNYLRDTDFILARNGFSFWKMMQKEEYNKNIKSKTFYWNIGQEIIDLIKKNE